MSLSGERRGPLPFFLQKGIDKPVAMGYHQVEVSDD